VRRRPRPRPDAARAPVARIGSAWDAFTVRTELIVLAILILVGLSYLAYGRV
jgi:hypothetical protein